MPVKKLRLASLIVEIWRVVAGAVSRAGAMLLLPVGLLILPQWAELELGSAVKPYSIAGMAIVIIGILASWMMLLIVSRSSLCARSGLDLLRLDRLALMLLALEAIPVIVAALLVVPQRLAFQMLFYIVVMAIELLWARMTFLLGISWAIGVDMTMAQSWKRLQGNFLRFIGLGLLSVLAIVVFTLAYAYFVHGNVSPPYPPPPLAVSVILSVLAAVVDAAAPCAIYRQLVMEPLPPSAVPEGDAFAA